jgi:type II secretory pathway pseudopilin PulG
MKFRHNNFYKAQSAFTMVEIALSLAVIGIALVSIIGVLPIGMNVQRDNREETIIDQDATVFIEAIRSGAVSPYATDLTNYVYAITNYQTLYNNNGIPETTTPTLYGYTLTTPYYALTNNARIIGLLSTPEYTDSSFNPTNNLFNGGYSNHVVAYVHSISGDAVEKPPQDNSLIQQDSFGYEISCGNVPVQVDTNSLNTNSPNYSYNQQLTANLHEMRLTFLWPLLPSGNTGPGRHTFRSMVGGQIMFSNDFSVTPPQPLYFIQSQSFTNAPVP